MRKMLIQEVSARTGVSERMLRHYEKLGLLHPSRTDAGYRVYGDDDLRQIVSIGKYRKTGLPLKEIVRLINEQDCDRQAICEEHLRGLHKRLQTTRAQIRETEKLLALIAKEKNDEKTTGTDDGRVTGGGRDAYGDADSSGGGECKTKSDESNDDGW